MRLFGQVQLFIRVFGFPVSGYVRVFSLPISRYISVFSFPISRYVRVFGLRRVLRWQYRSSVNHS